MTTSATKGQVSEYIADSEAEGARIEQRTERALTLEQLGWAGIRPGNRVLDVGCGEGATSRLMADIVGEGGHVIGLDASFRRLEDAFLHPLHTTNISYVPSDAHRIPLEDRSVDVAWTRFMLEYSPNPELIVGEMARVTRPGGTVVLSDLDGNCIWNAPSSRELDLLMRDAMATFGSSFDPRIGLRLYSLAYGAGLGRLEVDIRPYHVVAGAIDSVRRDHWQQKLDGVAAALVRRGWARSRANELIDRMMDHLCSASTFSYSVLITVRGTRFA